MQKGLERNWLFECNEETGRCDYRITLDTDCYAYYYVFFEKADKVKPSLNLKCTDDDDFHYWFNDYVIERMTEDDEQYKDVNLKEVEI